MDAGTIGEYYVLCELWRRGFNALKSENPREENWDILILSETYSKTITKIQVKTIDWNNKTKSKVLTGKYYTDFDYLFIVILNYMNIGYSIYIIPKSKIKPKGKGQRNILVDSVGNFLYKNRTISCTKIMTTDKAQKYRDNWGGIYKQCGIELKK
ncbi:hypothetical protein ABH961_004458 [Bacillus sp. RC251]|uniref:hypothetical protein n=1 Tax=Bacillus sp. RC251 TaxID=3156290 RepID=UPI0038341F41